MPWSDIPGAAEAAAQYKARQNSRLKDYKGGPPTITVSKKNKYGQTVTKQVPTGGERKYSGGPPTISQIRTSKKTDGNTTTITHKRVDTNTAGQTSKEQKKAAAQRRVDAKSKDMSKQNSDSVEAYRRKRIRNKEYKGKYYGPDVFRGDMALLKAWRASGSPKDTAKFAAKN